MSGVVELVAEFEARGGEFGFDGNQINVQYPPERREALALILETLRANREAVAAFVRERSRGVTGPAQCPPLPPGVRLVRYAPKTPPVDIAPISVVTDVDMFIHSYLRDLRYRLEHPKAYACAPLPEILAKLADVGLELTLERA